MSGMGQKVPASISGARRVSLKGPLPLENVGLKTTTKVRAPEAPTPPSAPSGPAVALDLPVLSKAIRRSVGHDGMRREDADAIAGHILNFFGFNERIIDNVLEPDDRDTFYMLEDSGILETERDETTLYDGREWRIHYWMFRKDRILQLAREEEEASPKEEPTEAPAPVRRVPLATSVPSVPPLMDSSVYHQLSDEVWGKREGEEEDENAPQPPMTTSRLSRGPLGPS
jgi:hypothetical protein